MEVNLEFQYNLRLNAQEFRIIALALSGKELSNDLVKEALVLNEKLLAMRVHQLNEQLKAAAGAHVKATELLEEAKV